MTKRSPGLITIKLGYNDHCYNDQGYNEFTFITDKILPNFLSQRTSYYIVNLHVYRESQL